MKTDHDPNYIALANNVCDAFLVETANSSTTSDKLALALIIKPKYLYNITSLIFSPL